MTCLRLLLLASLLPTAVACGGDGGGGGGDDDGPDFAEDHPRIYLERNRDRLVAALEAGGDGAARFADMVDDQVGGGDNYNFQAWHAALMGQLTGDAKYCAYAVAQVEAYVAGEEALIAGGERPELAGDSYLRVGEDVGNIALTYDWCNDVVTADQAERWIALARQAVLNVWDPDNATWGGTVFDWSGWSIDNPANNYYYSFLRATMLLALATNGEIPEAAGWLDFVRTTKLEEQLVPLFAAELAGGGSREGTGYGVSMRSLFELYDFWEGSTGERIADLTPHTRASMIHFMHEIVPTLDFVAPIGDHSRDSTAALFDYHRFYALALMHLFPDDPAAAELNYQFARSSVPRMGLEFMYVYDFLYDPSAIAETAPALTTTYHAAGIGQVFSRSSWADDATFFHMSGGPYTESHDHHDEGSFLFFKGEWLAYDANIESNSGIHAEADCHNLVRLVRGGETVPMDLNASAELLAVHRGEGYVHTAVDVAPVFEPDEGVAALSREMIFLPPDILIVFDRVDGGDADAIWQLSSPINPTIAGGRATFAGAVTTMVVDRVLPVDAPLVATPWPTLDSDMDAGYRLDVASNDGTFVHVLSVDGAVASAAPYEADGKIGVTIERTGGGTVTALFTGNAVDTVLNLGDGDIALGAGIDAIDER